MYDAAAIRAQRDLHAIQGVRDTYLLRQLLRLRLP